MSDFRTAISCIVSIALLAPTRICLALMSLSIGAQFMMRGQTAYAQPSSSAQLGSGKRYEMSAANRAAFAKLLNIPETTPDMATVALERLSKLPAQRPPEENVQKGLEMAFGPEAARMGMQGFFASLVEAPSTSNVPQRIVDRFDFAEGEALTPVLAPDASAQAAEAQEKIVEQFLPEERIKANIETSRTLGLKTIDTFMTARRIPACSGAKTTHMEVPQGTPESDILVIAGEPSLDSDELYGSKTRVIWYRPGRTENESVLLVSLMEPDCLPYRVRIVGQQRSSFYGEPALRNYDGRKNKSENSARKRKGADRDAR